MQLAADLELGISAQSGRSKVILVVLQAVRGCMDQHYKGVQYNMFGITRMWGINFPVNALSNTLIVT